ncbi:MAG: hypothetical protein M5U12_12575 [Verrucomicrobia bacterium]|nr:hypothetical protein [Verrucomicrobiota bacterium]
MQRLEAKRVNGHTYYYLSDWGWREGKCRRLAQLYLGKLEQFSSRLTGAGPAPAYAEVFESGRPPRVVGRGAARRVDSLGQPAMP